MQRLLKIKAATELQNEENFIHWGLKRLNPIQQKGWTNLETNLTTQASLPFHAFNFSRKQPPTIPIVLSLFHSHSHTLSLSHVRTHAHTHPHTQLTFRFISPSSKCRNLTTRCIYEVRSLTSRSCRQLCVWQTSLPSLPFLNPLLPSLSLSDFS